MLKFNLRTDMIKKIDEQGNHEKNQNTNQSSLQMLSISYDTWLLGNTANGLIIPITHNPFNTNENYHFDFKC